MLGTTAISNTSDVIDSREIVERINYLEIGDDQDEVELDELATLKSLCEEMRSYSGDSPEDGVTLIRDSDFEDYAQELAEDIGAISKDYQWPLSHIDWGAAADALKMDYTTIEFDGVTYWYR